MPTILTVVKGQGTNSEQAVDVLLQELNKPQYTQKPFSVCGNISFCTEYVKTGLVATAGSFTQIVTAHLLLILEADPIALVKE